MRRCIATLRILPSRRVSPAPGAAPLPQPAFGEQHLLPEHDASDDLTRVKAARIKLQHDMRLMQERLELRREEAARLKEDLKTLGLL